MSYRVIGRPFNKKYIETARITVNTSTTETGVTGLTIGGNGLGIGSVVAFDVFGTISSKLGAACNMVWKLYLGTTARLTLTKSSLTQSLSGVNWRLRAKITILTATTARIDGYVESYENSGTKEISIFGGADIASLDLTAEMNAKVTGTLSQSDVANQFTIEQAEIERY